MRYTLHVGSGRGGEEYDLGSTVCLAVVQRLPEGLVEVVAADASLRSSWLTGTPTLSDEDTAWTGSRAMEQLLDVLAAAAKPTPRSSAARGRTDEGAGRVARAGPKEGGGGPGPALAPVAEEEDDKIFRESDMSSLAYTKSFTAPG